VASLDPDNLAHRGQLRAAARDHRIRGNLQWFVALSHQEAGPPLAPHKRGRAVWTDADVGGSRLGSPADSPEWQQWLGRSRQHWPLRSAIARLHGEPVRQGLPRVDATLAMIAATGGNLERAADVLARRHPLMGDPPTALGHFADVLGRVRVAWTKEARRCLAVPNPEHAQSAA
jgi:hypothetical protein